LATAALVAFFVRRTLASGPVRFGVAERAATPADGPPHLLSTGPRGDFVRRGPEGLYFAEQREVGVGPLEELDPSRGLTLWALLRPEGDSIRSYLPLAAMVLGGLLIVMGIGVLTQKQDPIGWVEIILGVVLIIAPVVIAARRLILIRDRARKEREERERKEAERRRIVGDFAERLEAVLESPSRKKLDAIRKERRDRDIPYDAIAALGRAAVAQIGFYAFREVDQIGPPGVAARLREAADAVGLNHEDACESYRLVLQKIIWHLLADDRLNDQRIDLVAAVSHELGLGEEDLLIERKAAAELESLRGMDGKSLPVLDGIGAPLRFGERCHHVTRGATVKRLRRGSIKEQRPFDLYVTAKRVLLNGAKEEISYPDIFGMEVDADEGLLEITLRDRRAPLLLRVDDPIRTAQMIDLASTQPPKPKGLI
jgi:hypothetical protein